MLSLLSQIRDNAELAVRNLLKGVALKQGTTELHSVDYLDDGTPIALHVSIDADKGSAVFDFEGTGAEIFGWVACPYPPQCTCSDKHDSTET